jgi:hypothetical protein
MTTGPPGDGSSYHGAGALVASLISTAIDPCAQQRQLALETGGPRLGVSRSNGGKIGLSVTYQLIYKSGIGSGRTYISLDGYTYQDTLVHLRRSQHIPVDTISTRDGGIYLYFIFSS